MTTWLGHNLVCLCGILQESFVSEDVVRDGGKRRKACVPVFQGLGAAADKPTGSVDIHTGGGKAGPAFFLSLFFLSFYFLMMKRVQKTWR